MSITFNNQTINSLSPSNIYKLTSPHKHKGQIIKGPLKNAFNKENLGSIPCKIENILYKNGKSPQSFPFKLTNSLFQTREGSDSNLISRSPTLPSLCKNGFGSGFRFENESKNEFLNKFSPGPGDHDVDYYTIKTNIDKTIHFRSLHKMNKSLKTNQTSPGPGKYYIKSDFDRKVKENKGKRNKFERRVFFNESDSRQNKEVGNLESLIKVEGSPIKGGITLNTTTKGEDSKDYIKRKDFYENVKKIIKEKEMGKEKRKEGKKERRIFKNSLRIIEMKPQPEQSEEKNLIISNVPIKKDDFDFYQKYKELMKKPSFYFLSKSPKISHISNKTIIHNPGPSYYNPNLLPSKLSFNVFQKDFRENLEYISSRKWI